MNPQPPSRQDRRITRSLSDSKKWVTDVFALCHDLKLKDWRYGADMRHTAFSVYFDTMTDKVDNNYMKSLMRDLSPLLAGLDDRVTPQRVGEFFESEGIATHTPQVVSLFSEAEHAILDGFIVIFIAGWDCAVTFQMPGTKSRSVSEPTMEPVVFGPHNSTIEDLKTNVGLIRGLLRTPKLKFESLIAGQNSRRQIVYGYVDGIVRADNLKLFKERIHAAKEKEILETTFLADWVSQFPYSPFPQTRFTERPDVATSALLEGKIIALVEGSPTIMICPGLFVEFFTSSEDYYQNSIFSTLIRWLRIAAFIMALTLPSLYIALTTFHPELIPTVLLLAILDTREKIPFPAVVEALLMEFFFELLREAGIRLPRPIGSAVSIVGALVIGQAAIQAKIASPSMVIVVALTGIASFSMPQYNFGIALRVLRFPLMILAATLGGFGLMVGYLFILLHLVKLQALAEPYLKVLAPFKKKTLLGDVLLRRSMKKQLKTSKQRPLG